MMQESGLPEIMKIYSETYSAAENAKGRCMRSLIRAGRTAVEAMPMNAGEPII